jgi:CheY-like chemotaxis protein
MKSVGAAEVLIIDDDDAFLRDVQYVLGRRGVSATGCTNRQEALHFAADKQFRMIVCEYFMPRIDGRSLLRRIHNLRPDCRLILTSSYPIGTQQANDGTIEFIDKSELPGFISKEMSRRHLAGELIR